MSIKSRSKLAAAALVGACLAGCAGDRSMQTETGDRVDVAEALANAGGSRPSSRTDTIHIGAGDYYGAMLYTAELARAARNAPATSEVAFHGQPEAGDPAK